jgi:putative Mn2+ efflux pump MntP
VVALLLVALSVGLDNFGASAALGLSGVDAGLRLRCVLVFGVFESAMPVVGIVLGHSLAHRLGHSADAVGGTLLGLAGAYALMRELTGTHEHAPEPATNLARLLLLGAALSIDNLVIGFALGTSLASLVLAALTIGGVSVALSLLGLEVGSRLGGRLGRRSGLAGGAVLVLVGVGVGIGLL